METNAAGLRTDVQKSEQPLLTGTTPDGKHVELTFTDVGGYVKVAGEIVCHSEAGPAVAVRQLVVAFHKACGQELQSHVR